MRLTLGVALAVVLAAGAFASGGSSATSADCSKAEATAIVKRLRLGYADYLPNPVYQVICGAFMGPRSQTMVALLASGGASNPFGGWAVFRLVRGAWQLVMERTGGGRITAAGPDLRETVSVLREGDSRCCPSGGTKARIWHWSGTRFTAGPWKQATPGTPSAAGVFRSGYFKTPSGNIVCYHSPGPADLRRAFLGCGIKSGLKPAPPRRPCEEGGYAGDRVSINATGRVSVPACAGDPGALVGAREARVLGYGKTWSGGGLSCASAVAGLTCRNKSGHGFFLSRAQWRAF
jgi:hypothetical protein